MLMQRTWVQIQLKSQKEKIQVNLQLLKIAITTAKIISI